MRCLWFAGVLVLVACGGPEPRSSAEKNHAIASECVAVYEAWDEARLRALFPPGVALEAAWIREHNEWLHEQLGECGTHELMWSNGADGSRWRRTCERGALEFAFALNRDGRVRTLRSGAAGIPTPPAVLAAAEAVLASLPWDSGASYPFRHNLNSAANRRLGSCAMERPWVVSRRGGLFHVRCDEGGAEKTTAAVLRVELDEHSALAQTDLLPGNSFKGPPIVAARP